MMTADTADINIRPLPDRELITLANYVTQYEIKSDLAWSTALDCFIDALACGFLALKHPACARLIGPIVPNTTVPNGARVPGTEFELDPIQAAFSIGTIIRWLDFNDTWLAAEWGHPSDNLGAILAVSDYVSRCNLQNNKPPLTLRDVLSAQIKAYEIQGVFALQNSMNRIGLDHVAFVKVASAATAMHLLGGTHDDIVSVLSHAWIDGQSLRTYRHAPNTGSRKSWAAGDATSRAVRLAWLVHLGEKGYPTALTAKKWGFYDVTFHGQPFQFEQPLGSYVMENILFKVSFPAEFHAQTAVECAIALHNQIINRFDDIDSITLTTQESAVRIISKTGPLYNYADRDHCLQYMVAVALLHGDLKAEYYNDTFAKDPRIDALRDKMRVIEDPTFSKDYLDPNKRSIANAVQIHFRDGTSSEKIQIDYPIGHKNRRVESKPLLQQKFESAVRGHFSSEQADKIMKIFSDRKNILTMPVNQLMELLQL